MFDFEEESVDSRAKSIKEITDELPDITGQSKYSFLIITDPHFGASHERDDNAFIKKFEKLLQNQDKSLQPKFLVNLGDTLNAGKKSEARDYTAFCEKIVNSAKKISNTDNFKIYTILGNHDLYNTGWNTWKKHIYPYTSYYHFELNSGSENQGFSYYFIDSANGSLGSPQLNSLKKSLYSDSKPKIIFTHYALYAGGVFYATLQNSIERNIILSYLEETNTKYVFSGHKHKSHIATTSSFTERLIPSFLYSDVCCLVTVDEENQSVKSSLIYF